MASLPLKADYGPTLGQLLGPRVRTLPRVLLVVAALLVAVIVFGSERVAHKLKGTTFSHPGAVAFHFRYKHMQSVAAPAGAVTAIKSTSGGRLADSYTVRLLHLPPYPGYLAGYLPLWATGYIRQLKRTLPHFQETGEGKTRLNSVPGYAVDYRYYDDGVALAGRNIILLPNVAGVRGGVIISMVTRANPMITSDATVGGIGVLKLPLRSFHFGA